MSGTDPIAALIARHPEAFDERQRPKCGVWDPMFGPCICGDVRNHKPYAVVDCEADPPVVLARLLTEQEASEFIGRQPDQEKVNRGGYAIDGPEVVSLEKPEVFVVLYINTDGDAGPEIVGVAATFEVARSLAEGDRLRHGPERFVELDWQRDNGTRSVNETWWASESPRSIWEYQIERHEVVS